MPVDVWQYGDSVFAKQLDDLRNECLAYDNEVKEKQIMQQNLVSDTMAEIHRSIEEMNNLCKQNND